MIIKMRVQKSSIDTCSCRTNNRMKTISSPVGVLLLLCVASVLGRETCPPKEDIAPCVCTKVWADFDEIDIDCEAEKHPDIDLKSIFAELQGKKIWDVWLDSVPMKRIPTDLFKGMIVRRLIISNGDLEGLADTDDDLPFQGLEHSLQELHIRTSFKGSNQLTHLKLSHLKELTEIEIEDSYVPEVKNEWFQDGPYSLKKVTFIRCSVKSVGNKAFATLPHLEELILTDNEITEFSRSMLPKPAPELVFIYLDNNKVYSLPEDIFTDMPKLEHLDLEDCGIRQLPEATWSPVWSQLDFVYLYGNPLECDSHMDWMFGKKRPKSLIAICESPPERKGRSLANYIDDHENDR